MNKGAIASGKTPRGSRDEAGDVRAKRSLSESWSLPLILESFPILKGFPDELRGGDDDDDFLLGEGNASVSGKSA